VLLRLLLRLLRLLRLLLPAGRPGIAPQIAYPGHVAGCWLAYPGLSRMPIPPADALCSVLLRRARARAQALKRRRTATARMRR
jgi:hypothetical protein